ncbi:OLC1v1015972C1 [Oldenlandia corymbosa var. corymbosa]|uniref:OLC1v1015972C1 n=1 Tax=Oldenlandia corymbosa var. corymbosa TaxID=529605 RepID=A0AAV1E747_OLDCO|nr:OLC1v1015972C1 [Oldenlandia corymbosa var. corymbosa]
MVGPGMKNIGKNPIIQTENMQRFSRGKRVQAIFTPSIREFNLRDEELDDDVHASSTVIVPRVGTKRPLALPENSMAKDAQNTRDLTPTRNEEQIVQAPTKATRITKGMDARDWAVLCEIFDVDDFKKRLENRKVTYIEAYKVGHYSNIKGAMVNEKASETLAKLESLKNTTDMDDIDVCLEVIKGLLGHARGRSTPKKQVLAIERSRDEIEKADKRAEEAKKERQLLAEQVAINVEEYKKLKERQKQSDDKLEEMNRKLQLLLQGQSPNNVFPEADQVYLTSIKSMDKSWIQIHNRTDKRYGKGVTEFLEFAYKNLDESDEIPCPRKICNNYFDGTREEVEKHLYVNGIRTSYVRWMFHGEDATNNTNPENVVNGELEDGDDDLEEMIRGIGQGHDIQRELQLLALEFPILGKGKKVIEEAQPKQQRKRKRLSMFRTAVNCNFQLAKISREESLIANEWLREEIFAEKENKEGALEVRLEADDEEEETMEGQEETDEVAVDMAIGRERREEY